MTRVEAALRIASLVSSTGDPGVHRAALAALPSAVDAAQAELVAAGAPESAGVVARACLLLVARPGHLSADTCPPSGHLSG